MDLNKREFEWPAYSTWWERNEKMVNIVLWAILLVLLIIARVMFTQEMFNLKAAVIWGIMFFLDLFVLSFVTRR